VINLNLQTTTGVYVGARNVYIAQVQGTFFGPRLLKFGQTEIQAQEGADQTTKDKAIVQAIKKVLDEQNISAKKVVTALPGKDVLVRYFQMPKIPKSEWETAIKFEAKKYIPFKIEELMWDFHVGSASSKESTKMDVTFVAVKRKIAQDFISLLEEAGLKASILEPAPFSLVRVFALSNQLDGDKPTAVVDVDYGMADINIVKEKMSYLTRDVSLPLEQEVLFDSLLNEIRMSLDYYEKLFPAETISRILLSGELELQDWDRKLADELKMPVEKVDLVKAIKTQKALPPLNMAVALGLALRGMGPAATEVNLYQFREVKPQAALTAKEVLAFTPEMRQALIRSATLSGIGLAILYLIMLSPIARERKKVKEIMVVRPKISIPVEGFTYSDLEKIEKDLERRLSVLDLLVGKDVFVTDKFNELPKIIPPGIWLTNFSFSDRFTRDGRINRSLTIRGVAYHENPVREIGLVTKFVSNAKANANFAKGFQDIKLSSMTASELKGMPVKDFTISCTTK